AERAALAGAAAARRSAGEAAAETARKARRELDKAAEVARRESARIGAELAKANQFLRANAGAPGGAPALADLLAAAPGYELALTAALGPRMRAAVAADLQAGAALLSKAGKDGAAALIVPASPTVAAPPATGPTAAFTSPAASSPPAASAPSPPAPGAEPLAAH